MNVRLSFRVSELLTGLKGLTAQTNVSLITSLISNSDSLSVYFCLSSSLSVSLLLWDFTDNIGSESPFLSLCLAFFQPFPSCIGSAVVFPPLLISEIISLSLIPLYVCVWRREIESCYSDNIGESGGKQRNCWKSSFVLGRWPKLTELAVSDVCVRARSLSTVWTGYALKSRFHLETCSAHTHTHTRVIWLHAGAHVLLFSFLSKFNCKEHRVTPISPRLYHTRSCSVCLQVAHIAADSYSDRTSHAVYILYTFVYRQKCVADTPLLSYLSFPCRVYAKAEKLVRWTAFERWQAVPCCHPNPVKEDFFFFSQRGQPSSFNYKLTLSCSFLLVLTAMKMLLWIRVGDMALK